MEKTKILQQLKTAKTAHKNWVTKAKMLINGFDIEADSIPMSADACEFGKWFHHEAKKLSTISSAPFECMKDINVYHTILHNTYENIYKIYYTNEKNSFFNKLFGIKKEVTQKERELSMRYFHEMEDISHRLIEELNKMENRIMRMDATKLNTLSN
ncbi:MAG: CZB domain-containing protein [Sulfurimonadaceae bacterium]|jgi:pantothenate kinase|nr:CZB domain-containing protein [Sulfurimonadaceae bacterium]